jgi:hypothetical protein
MKKVNSRILKALRYICLSCVVALGLISIVGTGGGGGGSVGTAPEINNVVLTDADFNPKSVFDIGDAYNVLVTATDPDKNMKELSVTQFTPDDTEGDPYYGPDTLLLPSQSDDVVTYYLISDNDIDGPAGTWRVEFQITDSTRLESNTFIVFAITNP